MHGVIKGHKWFWGHDAYTSESHSNHIEGVLNFWPHTYNSGYAIDLRKEQMSRKENKVKKI